MTHGSVRRKDVKVNRSRGFGSCNVSNVESTAFL